MYQSRSANLREDVRTAAAIDHGLALQGIAGPATAYQYLTQHRIPAAIIKRVMSSPLQRRKAGTIGIPPLTR